MEKANPKKAKSFRFSGAVTGGLVCPYCNKWLGVQLTEKVVPGVVLCRECFQPMRLDKKACSEINERNTRVREVLFYPRIRRTIYEGYKNGKEKKRESDKQTNSTSSG